MGRPTTMVGAWRKLADAVGGVAALAKLLDRRRQTILRWSTGELDPRNDVKAAVGTLAAQHGVAMPPFGEDAKRAIP